MEVLKISKKLFWAFVVINITTTIHVNAILNRQVQFPPSSSSSSATAHHHHDQNQQHGGGNIVARPSPSWPATEVNYDFYLNQECSTDNDCYPSKTILYCISYRCQCITGGATYLNGFFYNYNMEWNHQTRQCSSKSGSPCTLRQFRNYPDILTMECIRGNDCVELNSPAAQATIAGQTAAGFGSSVSVQQFTNHGQQPHSHYTNVQYFGSGASGVAGGGGGSITTNDKHISGHPIIGSSSATTAASSNTWGICVPRTGSPYHQGLSESSSSASGPKFFSLATFVLLLLIPATFCKMY